MRRFAKLVALLAAMTLLVACAAEPSMPSTDPTPTKPQTVTSPHIFTLAYCRSDSLNPFLMTSRTNRALCGLLYEGLTTFDEAMGVQNALAESVRVNGTELVAVLRADAVFSNGEQVVAADVMASFEAAKQSAYYKELLRRVDRAEVRDTRTVVFHLSEPDPFAASSVSFPVVRVAEDGTVLGSGPYVFDETPRLTVNTRVSDASFSAIRLLDLRGDEEMATGLEMGNLSYFFSDLSDGELPRAAGAIAAVPMNYFVFLGVNSSRDAMSNAEVRRAISLALDRTALAQNAYSGYAEAAGTVFPPRFAAANKVAQVSATADRTAASAALSSAGYATISTDDTAQKALSLTLLYNSDNSFRTALAQLLKTQLSAVGITVTLLELPYNDYRVALKNGRYDLYIGEVRLTDNLDLSPILTPRGAAGYGITSKNSAVSAYAAFCKGECSLSDFTEEFSSQLPIIPLCWRNGMAAYNRALTGVSPTSFNVYYGLVNWKLTNQKGV